LKGATSPRNCARKMPGPFIVRIVVYLVDG
jgi:hypothetical protein